MDSKQKVLWNKLNLNLELLSVSDPSSILPLILEIEGFIKNENYSHILQKLNFMSFELIAKCKNLNELDRQTILTDYFFNEKTMQVNHLSTKTIDINDWLLSDTIDNSQGVSLLVSLIYTHLAQTLEIPIYLISTKNDNLLKWVIGDNPIYLDITQNCSKLNDKQFCEYLLEDNKFNDKISNDCFDILPSKNIITRYLERLHYVFDTSKEFQYTKVVLDILLKLEPSNLKYIKQRALICKDLNLNKQALQDINNYFSLNGKEQAPKEIMLAYYDLKALNTPMSRLIH